MPASAVLCVWFCCCCCCARDSRRSRRRRTFAHKRTATRTRAGLSRIYLLDLQPMTMCGGVVRCCAACTRCVCVCVGRALLGVSFVRTWGMGTGGERVLTPAVVNGKHAHTRARAQSYREFSSRSADFSHTTGRSPWP